MLTLAASILSVLAIATVNATTHKANIINNDNSLIYFHGRWDTSPSTWWASTGFTLNVEGLTSMTINLGNHTSNPLTSTAVSVDYGAYNIVNMTLGANVIPLTTTSSKRSFKSNSVVRVLSGDWQNNRMHLESIELNEGAKLLPYTPSKLAFLFIGDSLSAGQYLPDGIDQAWPVLTGEAFKAERTVVAQPGACLTDIPSYGNIHGISYEFFRTEDDGYFYTSDHNFTTPWNFARDKPEFTHVVIHIGANDASQNITGDAFVQTYLSFVTRLRTIYPSQPIFVFSPWGWPNPDGTVNYYYNGQYQEIVDKRHSIGDKKVFLVNTTGWVDYSDIYPTNSHPNVQGHEKIAGLFETYLQNWGLKPEKAWATSA